MSRLHTFIIIICYFFCSCKPIYKEINGVNKEKKFINLSDYKNFIEQKTSLNSEKVFVVENKNYNDLIFDVSERRVVYYYGIFEKSKLIANGSDLKEKSSCYSSISKAIDNDINSITEDSVITGFLFLDFKGNPIKLDFDKKLIVFIFSYKLGRLSNNLNKLIEELKNKNQSNNFIILSLDNSSIQKIE